MLRRPLTLAVCLFVTVLIILTAADPSFPFENKTTMRLRDLEQAEETVTVRGLIRAVSETESGSVAIRLTQAVITQKNKEGRRAGSVRVRQIRLYTDETELKNLSGCSSAEESGRRMCGHRLAAEGDLSLIRGPTDPGQFDSRLYERIRGCPYRLKAARLTALDPKRAGLKGCLASYAAAVRDRIDRVYPSYAKGVASALIIGDRTLMPEEEQELWRMSGAAHILAISGLHLTLIGMACYSILRKIGTSLYFSSAASALLLFSFSFMTGFSLSSVRAFIMFLYVTGGRVIGRPPDRITAVSLAAVLMLAEDPAYLLDTGFQLSFSAAGILALFAGKGRLRTAVLLILLPLPLAAWHYFEIPLFSLLFNLILVPCLPVVFIFAALGMLFGGMAVLPASGLIYLTESLFRLIELRFPLTLITGRPLLFQCFLYEAFLAGGLFLYSLKKRERKRLAFYLLIPLLILLLIRPRSRGLSLTMLDVGQGDCFVTLGPGRTVCLIDGGSSSLKEVGRERLMPYLKYEGADHVDYLFVTHMDDDHVGGIRELLETAADKRTSIRIGTVVLPYRPWAAAALKGLTEEENEEQKTYCDLAAKAKEAGSRLLVMKKGDSVTFPPEGRRSPETAVVSLGPDPAAHYSNENEASLVLKISCGSFDILMTGDLGEEGEEAVLDACRKDGQSLKCECLKAGHHGSRYSTSGTFLKAVSPETVLISCGYHNVYGHPHKALLDRLSEAQETVFRTDQNGAVKITTDGRKWTVRSFKRA